MVVDARKIADYGIGSSIQGLLAGLAAIAGERAHDLDLVCVLPRRGERVAIPAGIASVTARARGYGLLEHVELPWIARRARAALYHAPHYVLPLALGSIPAVVTIHDLIHLRFAEQLASRAARAYARRTIASAYRRARRVIVPSGTTRAELLARFGGDAERVCVVPNGIDPRFFDRPADAEIAAVARAHALPDRYVLHVGNVKPHKNVERLAAAFACIAAEIPDAGLVLAGAPPDAVRAHLAPLERLGAATRVRVLGRLPSRELRALYHGARVFVFPSLWEGFGLPPLEALAAGVPVVAARAGALPETLGDAALLVDPLEVDAIADALRAAWSDEAWRESAIERGRARARTYTFEAQARATLDVWRAVVAE